MKALSISARLWVIILFLSASLLSLWASSRYFQGRVNQDFALRQQLATVQQLLLQMRAADKDFLHSHEHVYLEQFESLYEDFSSHFDELERQAAASNIDGVDLAKVSSRFNAYADAFRNVVEVQKLIGLSVDDGLYGALQESAQAVEVVARQDPSILSALLSLRQHEKDFILYRRPIHATEFATGLSDFRGVMFMSDLDNSIKASVQSALRRYTDSFNALVQAEIDIGLDVQSGLIGEMRDQAGEADRQFAQALERIEQHTEKDIHKADTLLSAWVALIIASAISLVLYARYRIVKNIGQAVDHARALSEGKWEQPIASTSTDETGILLNSMETMRRALINSTNTLRRDSQLKDQVNQLGQIIRGVKDARTLCNEVVSHLAASWGAQAGAVYLLDTDGLLKLSGSYGLSRDQQSCGVYQLGESLIGQAAMEQRFMLLSRVPAGYLSISSGTGSTTPNAVLVAPLVWNGQLYGALELASLTGFPSDAEAFFNQAGEQVAVAIHASNARNESEKMLIETQKQAHLLEQQQQETERAHRELLEQAQRLQASEEKMQAQQEELRVINEELEAQGKLAIERTRLLEQRNRRLEAQLQTMNA